MLTFFDTKSLIEVSFDLRFAPLSLVVYMHDIHVCFGWDESSHCVPLCIHNPLHDMISMFVLDESCHCDPGPINVSSDKRVVS